MKLQMTITHLGYSLTVLLVLLNLTGCTGISSFTTAARAGDTVALSLGWNKNITRQNLTVKITPAVGSPVVYGPNDPALRAVVNMYPDPASRLVVGFETNQSLGYGSAGYAGIVYGSATNQDRDWYETELLVDLPPSLSVGTATITLSTPAGPVMFKNGNGVLRPTSVVVDILPGTGSPNTFGAAEGVTLGVGAIPILLSLERGDTNTVSLNGARVPYAVQMTLAHTPGVGIPWIGNARGDTRNIMWTDDGTNLKVMVILKSGLTSLNLNDFKFSVAGGVAGLALQPSSLRAYDVNGNLLAGVGATITTP